MFKAVRQIAMTQMIFTRAGVTNLLKLLAIYAGAELVRQPIKIIEVLERLGVRLGFWLARRLGPGPKARLSRPGQPAPSQD